METIDIYHLKKLRNITCFLIGIILIIGCNSILNYLKTNPGFLSYRFGIEKALAMKSGLIELTEKCLKNEQNFSEIIVFDEI